MAQVEAGVQETGDIGRFEQLGSAMGRFLDRLLSPSVVAVGLVILSYIIIRMGFEMHRSYQSLGMDAIENVNDDLWQQVYSNLGIELLSIAITVIVIERLNKREAERERKDELILQMGSPDNAFAVEAVRILRQKGWGFREDKSLEGISLSYANLQKASLWGARMRNANLTYTSLKGATVFGIDLQYARLWDVDLQGSGVQQANLEGARLLNVNLKGVDFSHTNLRNVLFVANVEFDDSTTLPDGTKWTPGRDMREFTDPDGWAAGKYRE